MTMSARVQNEYIGHILSSCEGVGSSRVCFQCTALEMSSNLWATFVVVGNQNNSFLFSQNLPLRIATDNV